MNVLIIAAAALTAACFWALTRRAMTADTARTHKATRAHDAAFHRGEIAGTTHYLVTQIAIYQAAVHPYTPNGVRDDERNARRERAYQAAAEPLLPHTVREQAATILHTLDAGGLPPHEQLTTLMANVTYPTSPTL